jgi:hypothetical protein
LRFIVKSQSFFVSARRAGLARREFRIIGNLHKKFIQICAKFTIKKYPKTLDNSVRLCYNVVTTKGKKVNIMNEMYNTLHHYGEIIADKNHETTEGNFIRFTTYKYNDMYYIVIMCNGILVAISETNDVHNLVR